MQKFKVAHLNEQGQDMIIVLVNNTFGNMNNVDQNKAKNALQYCANSAGLRGTVVPVWDAGLGRMGFLAPTPWQNFFKNMDLSVVYNNINRELSCNL